MEEQSTLGNRFIIDHFDRATALMEQLPCIVNL